MNKKLAILGTALMSLPLVFAIDMGPLTDIMQVVFDIGSFVWVTDKLSATKFAIFVVMFAILYGVLHSGFVAKVGVLNNKKVSTVIAFALAALSVLFIPNAVALEIGNTYSAIAALLLAGVPAGLLLWFGVSVTNKDNFNPLIKHGVRLLVVLATISLLTGIGEQYGMFFILPLFWRSKK